MSLGKARSSLLSALHFLWQPSWIQLGPGSRKKIMWSTVAGISPVYAMLDLETTGFERKKDRIVQIGVVKVDRDVVTPWMAYVNPCKSREEQMEAYGVHRISPDVLQEKQTFADVAPKVCNFLENVQYIACYNCIFD